MSVRTKIGQQMIIGLSGHSLSSDEANFIAQNNIGGVILFARNLDNPAQIRKLCLELQALRHKMPDKAPLLIGIDMEGGRVHRLKAPFTQWPSQKLLGAIDSTSAAFKFSQCMGLELHAVGINLNFAPSVDVLTNPTNTAIGDRSLSSDPEQVAKLSSALVRGFIKAGVIPVAKHFPGHGNTIVDSHEELPQEMQTLPELETAALIPFKKAFRARLDMVMTSHILFPKIDPGYPVTLSKKFLTEILRDQLHFKNLVITDDLGMGALTKHHTTEAIAVTALQAGANILLYCNEPEAPGKAIAAVEKAVADGSLSLAVVEDNAKKVLALKRSKITNPEPLSLEQVSQIVGHPDHLKLAKAIIDGKIPEELLAT